MHLINNKSDRIVGVNDQIVMLHEELMLLGSSVTDIAVQQEAGHEDILIRAVDISYEVEYVINSFPPVWYLTLRLPQLIEKIQLIRMSILEIKNKIDVAGVPEVSKYPAEQVSLQSKQPPILEDIVVGFDNMEIEIAEQLVGGTEQLQIISISGMPGLDDGIGSRILFTTRNKEIGLEASPRSVIIALPFLSEDECWELFRRKVFQDKNCPQELLDIGKQIAANCRGLPLASGHDSWSSLQIWRRKNTCGKKLRRNLSSQISQTPD
ncbi:putative disease resistance RPP13-like protein 3 [Forsythia ovata]|uniref:Disease resistance RPP13-like protein 3 n=1 Tax=Forsythia ovata TaxID=205694 RepID=A0ABD1WPM8_9LAMI